MVLHAPGIVVDCLVIHPDELQEICEEMVAVGDIAGEGFVRGGEGKAAVFLGGPRRRGAGPCCQRWPGRY